MMANSVKVCSERFLREFIIRDHIQFHSNMLPFVKRHWIGSRSLILFSSILQYSKYTFRWKSIHTGISITWHNYTALTTKDKLSDYIKRQCPSGWRLKDCVKRRCHCQLVAAAGRSIEGKWVVRVFFWSFDRNFFLSKFSENF